MQNVILKVEHICKKYDDKEVVSDVSFSLMKGDILGFIGPNGAGKSTTIHMLTTILSSDKGKIYYREKDISKQCITFKKALGVVPQELAIYEDLNTYENVAFFCSLYGFKGSMLKKNVQEALEYVGLWDQRKQMPGKFSGGMKRRLNIACAIAHKPEILIMDEPTVGIDPQSRNHIMEMIKQLHKQGTSVIYTSHYMEEINALCNRIVLIDKGQIREDMKKEDLKLKYKEKGYDALEDIFLYLTGTDLRDLEG